MYGAAWWAEVGAGGWGAERESGGEGGESGDKVEGGRGGVCMTGEVGERHAVMRGVNIRGVVKRGDGAVGGEVKGVGARVREGRAGKDPKALGRERAHRQKGLGLGM